MKIIRAIKLEGTLNTFYPHR